MGVTLEQSNLYVSKLDPDQLATERRDSTAVTHLEANTAKGAYKQAQQSASAACSRSSNGGAIVYLRNTPARFTKRAEVRSS